MERFLLLNLNLKKGSPKTTLGRLTMGIVAEGGLALGHIQLVVEVSGQVLDPHRGAFWEESLAATQLLFQLRDIQLMEQRRTARRAQSK